MKIYEDKVHLVEVNDFDQIVISKKKNGIQITVCGNNYLVIKAAKDCKIEYHNDHSNGSFVVSKINESRAIPKEFK